MLHQLNVVPNRSISLIVQNSIHRLKHQGEALPKYIYKLRQIVACEFRTTFNEIRCIMPVGAKVGPIPLDWKLKGLLFSYSSPTFSFSPYVFQVHNE